MSGLPPTYHAAGVSFCLLLPSVGRICRCTCNLPALAEARVGGVEFGSFSTSRFTCTLPSLSALFFFCQQADAPDSGSDALKKLQKLSGEIRGSKGTPASLKHRQTSYEKAALEKKKKEKKGEDVKEADSPSVPMWVVIAIAVLLVGSALVQVLQTASSRPVTGA